MSTTIDQDRPQWAAMRRQDIHADVPLTLFDVPPVAAATVPVAPDRYGTPDMFADGAE